SIGRHANLERVVFDGKAERGDEREVAFRLMPLERTVGRGVRQQRAALPGRAGAQRDAGEPRGERWRMRALREAREDQRGIESPRTKVVEQPALARRIERQAPEILPQHAT